MTEKMNLNSAQSSARLARGPARRRIAAVIVALALAAVAALAGCGNGGKPGSPSGTPGSGPGYGFTAPQSASVIAQHTPH